MSRLDDSTPEHPPPDVIEAWARACRCCWYCWSCPCDGCCAGGVCDDMPCQCAAATLWDEESTE